MGSSEEHAVGGLIGPDSAQPITEPEPGLLRQVLVHSPAMMLVRHEMKRAGWGLRTITPTSSWFMSPAR